MNETITQAQPHYLDEHPQPLTLFHNTDWRNPPVNVHGCELKVGNYYWVHRKWNKYPIEKVRFFKVTPKGYAFRKLNLQRMFKRPLYPDPHILRREKKLVFYLSQNITVYTEEPTDQLKLL